MSDYRAVLFDLDGTLLDTAPDFHRVLTLMSERRKRPPVSFSQVRQTVSHGARALVTLGFGLQEGESGFEALRQELLEEYEAGLAIDSRLFDGLDHLLSELESRDLPWGIVTNKPRRYAEPLLEQLTLHRRCSVLVCPDDVSNTKPDPEPMLLAAKTLRQQPEHCCYVGDHRRDIEAGRNAGMPTIAAAYGYVDDSDPANSWQADWLAETPSQLVNYILERVSR